MSDDSILKNTNLKESSKQNISNDDSIPIFSYISNDDSIGCPEHILDTIDDMNTFNIITAHITFQENANKNDHNHNHNQNQNQIQNDDKKSKFLSGKELILLLCCCLCFI